MGKKGDQSESFSEDAYIYDDIPIELAGGVVENADVITADRLQLPEGTKAVYAAGNLVQNGELSDLSWPFIADDAGGMTLLWLFLPALIILILIFL